MSDGENPRESFDYYTDLMIEIDEAGKKVASDGEDSLVKNQVINSLFDYLLEIPNRVLLDPSIPQKSNKVVVINDVLDGLAETIKTNADECTKIGENTEQYEFALKKAIVFEKLADKLAQSIQQEEMPDSWQGYEDKLQTIIASTKIAEPAQEELAQDVFVLQDIAEENLRALEDYSFDTIRSSSFSAADRDVDPITKAIRTQILTKQRELIVETLVKNNIVELEEVGDLTKFRAYCENEENKEKISEVLKGSELKRALEQVEIAGYKNVHTQFTDRFSPMEWKDGAGESGNGITTKTQIVRDASGNEISTLTEATHQINPPQTVQKSDGTTVEIKNYRTIDFPIELKDGGPMHLSLAVKDQHGRNIAASKAVYFTAHYDDDGKLIEVSSPRPVKFNGTGSDAVGYIEHGGQIYTLPVTQEKYKAMMQEVAKNKGHGVDISQSIDTPSVDRIMTSHQKTEELGRTKEAVVSSPHELKSEEVKLELKTPEVDLMQFPTNDSMVHTASKSAMPAEHSEESDLVQGHSFISTINDDMVHTASKPTMPAEHSEESVLVQGHSFISTTNDDMVRTASKPAMPKHFEDTLEKTVSSLRQSLLFPPVRKISKDITKLAESLYANLRGKDLAGKKEHINGELDKLSTPQEKIELLQELVRVESDKRMEKVQQIALGGEEEANVGPVRVMTTQRKESINGSPKMGCQRKGEHVNVKDDVNLQKFLNDRIVEIKQESKKPVTTFKTRKVGGHGGP
ncbi:Sca4 family protein [Candidatus Tisiphia endosymbiont of Piscicola geometra]|uniref:Sca4 family protein n=1 Tax=Candidatus Tisiphia endosymbiont of Piscicola geometra TaxID=3066273 RepID=UPI00312CB564